MYLYTYVYVCIYNICSAHVLPLDEEELSLHSDQLALTGYCQCHFCMVYDIQKGGWGRGRILLNSRAIVL